MATMAELMKNNFKPMAIIRSIGYGSLGRHDGEFL